MPTQDDLHRILTRIDGRGYKAYKDIKGTYTFPSFTLFIDHIQSDPFASPSRFRVRIPPKTALYPSRIFENKKDYAHFRKFELAAALNRLRTLKVKQR